MEYNNSLFFENTAGEDLSDPSISLLKPSKFIGKQTEIKYPSDTSRLESLSEALNPNMEQYNYNYQQSKFNDFDSYQNDN